MIDKKVGIFYIFGMLFNKGIAFLTIPIFTRILSQNDYGVINVYTSYTNIFVVLVGLSLPLGIRAAFKEYEKHTQSFLHSINLLVAFIFLIEILLIFMVKFLLDIELYIYLPLVMIESFSRAIFNNYIMYLQMEVSYKLKTLLSVLLGLVSTTASILCILFLFEQEKYLGKIYSSVIVSLIFAILIIIKNKSKFNINYCKFAFKLCLPLVFHGLSLIILAQSDRLIINHYIGSAETGKYSLIYNLSMVLLAFSAALEGAWIPQFTKYLKERKIENINKMMKNVTYIITFFILIVMLMSPEVLKIMAPKEYWDATMMIPPILSSYFFIYVYTLYINVEHYHLVTKKIAKLTLIVALVNICLNVMLIPKYGGVGAAYATLFSYFISLILHKKEALKLERDLFPSKLFIVPGILIFLSIIVFIIFEKLLLMRYLCLIILLSTILIIKNKEIKKMIIHKEV